MKKYFGNADFWGGTASIACAVHCAALPILFSIGLVGSHHWLAHPFFEIAMLSITSWFVYKSLIKGFFKGQTRGTVFAIAIMGLICLLIHHFLGGYSTQVVVLGGILVGLSHIINFRSHSHDHTCQKI